MYHAALDGSNMHIKIYGKRSLQTFGFGSHGFTVHLCVVDFGEAF